MFVVKSLPVRCPSPLCGYKGPLPLSPTTLTCILPSTLSRHRSLPSPRDRLGRPTPWISPRDRRSHIEPAPDPTSQQASCSDSSLPRAEFPSAMVRYRCRRAAYPTWLTWSVATEFCAGAPSFLLPCLDTNGKERVAIDQMHGLGI